MEFPLTIVLVFLLWYRQCLNSSPVWIFLFSSYMMLACYLNYLSLNGLEKKVISLILVVLLGRLSDIPVVCESPLWKNKTITFLQKLLHAAFNPSIYKHIINDSLFDLKITVTQIHKEKRTRTQSGYLK